MAQRIRNIQTSFVGGQMDEDVQRREDVAAYYSSAAQMINMVVLPTGGATTRNGMEMITDLGERATLIPFEYGPGENYMICVRSGNFCIVRVDTQAVVASPLHTYTSAQALQLGYAHSLDTVILTHPDTRVYRLQRQGSDTVWVFEDFTPSIKNIMQHDFGDGEENVWSDARGWPASWSFHQGRSFAANTTELPTRVWGSNSEKGLFDFYIDPDATEPPDTDAVDAALDGESVSRVQAVYGLIDLFVMTTGGIYVQSESPIKPGSFVPLRHTESRVSKIRPLELEGEVICVEYRDDDADGSALNNQAVYAVLFDDGAKAYDVRNLSELAPSIFKNPVDLARVRSIGNQSVSFLYVVNGDGTCGMVTSSRRNDITALSQLHTKGKITQMASCGGKLFAVVNREINGVDKWFLERFRPDRFTDCGVYQESETAKAVWDGFDHLEGEVIQVRGDGGDLGDFTVEDGEITLPFPVNSVEGGLGFDWLIETMPLAMKLPDGALVGRRNRIAEAIIAVRETSDLKVNGKDVAVYRYGDVTYDGDAPTIAPFTGDVRQKFLGWNRTGRGATLTLEGSRPTPATILSVTMGVSV